MMQFVDKRYRICDVLFLVNPFGLWTVTQLLEFPVPNSQPYREKMNGVVRGSFLGISIAKQKMH
jgi:hypothetical protein